MALTAADWLTLAQAKKHLNMSASVGPDDAELEDFIQRSESAVSEVIGVVKQPAAPVVEYHDGGGRALILEKRPVFTVTSVSVLGTTVAAANRDTGTDGWYIASERGALLLHTSCFPTGFVKVTYTPGWADIPDSIELAALELLRHLWKTQRGAVQGRPGVRGEPIDPQQTQATAGAGYAFPNRVQELLQPFIQVSVS